ncbi:uncharacterized protein LOC124304842 [Neodiprion virginianus]|uniref:uncharacterized protein LOC124304842 n=1 Tax=Neodiprion virginianus TaxID=2961670 RepID=UPI001EE750FE|nr:uncharacterized protein LOC124304842 [Neodiprion virginianus]
MGRRVVAHLHEAASERLINVFAVLREDAIVRLIRYDRLLILYGNKLCRKYKKQHDGDMIRANLRMLGRLLSALKEINKNIIEFATIYDPKYYDDVISAINIVSLFNEKTNTYTHPSTAYSLGSLVKQIGNLLITDCIKRHDAIQKANTEDFLKLAFDDIGVSVNKTVVESQTQQKRRKKTELPSVQDIKKLLAYVDKKRKSAYQILETKFTYDAWLDLAQTTLTSVQVFNRRRAGEIERVFIEDFESFEGINEDHLEKLSADSQVLARKYVRFVIRGKLNRTVPVLLSSDLLACIQMMLKYRNKAEVPSENRYVFGIPGFEKNRYKYLRACYLLRKFAQESGADFPAKLTGTKLRKHIATNCINLNLSENEVNDVANFMGHADKIHREHYRQPIVSREILRMSKVLELAQGCVEDAEECTDDEEEDSDNNLLDDHRKIQKEINTKQQPIQTYDASCEIDDISNNLDADSLSEVENNLAAKYKRKATSKTSPYGAVKSKPRWTQEENEVAHKLFGKHILSATYPSLRTIRNLCTNYPSLAKRSPSVIKTWISNKIKKNKLEQ